MKLVEMICSLRKRLLISIQKRDMRDLEALHFTFVTLREMSYASHNFELTELLTDMEYAAEYARISSRQNAVAHVPSEEAIRAQFAGKSAPRV